MNTRDTDFIRKLDIQKPDIKCLDSNPIMSISSTAASSVNPTPVRPVAEPLLYTHPLTDILMTVKKAKSKREQSYRATKVHSCKRLSCGRSPEPNAPPKPFHLRLFPRLRWPVMKDEPDDTDLEGRYIPCKWYMEEICVPVLHARLIPRHKNSCTILLDSSSPLGRPSISRTKIAKISQASEVDLPVKPDLTAQNSIAISSTGPNTCMVYLKLHQATTSRISSVFSQTTTSLRNWNSTGRRPKQSHQTDLVNSREKHNDPNPHGDPHPPRTHERAAISIPDNCNRHPQMTTCDPLSANDISSYVKFIDSIIQLNKSDKSQNAIDEHNDLPNDVDPKNTISALPDVISAHAEQPITVISSNIQRRRWLSLFDRKYDVLLLQEATFLQSKRLGPGFLTESPNRSLIVWSRHKVSILKNLEYLQILEVVAYKKRFIITNIHLDNNPKSRKVQIDEIMYDCLHIKMNFEGVNIVAMGDFNAPSDKIKVLPLIRFNLDENTWRKSSSSDYTTMIDHCLHSESVGLDLETEETESDHKSLLASITRLSNHKGVGYLCERSDLSKKKTAESRPRNWNTYPDISTYGYLGPNKIKWTIRNEAEFQTFVKEHKDKVYREGLVTREEWRRAQLLCDMKPYRRISPMLDDKGATITSKKEYVNAAIAHLEKATASTLKKIKPKCLEKFTDEERETIVNMMIPQLPYINSNKSCGSDGVHPSWINEYDINDPYDVGKIKSLLLNSMNKNNFFSTRLALIPKKGTQEYRPSQVSNTPLRLLEKATLKKLGNIELENPECQFGFRVGMSTHDAFEKVSEYLKTSNGPCTFIDMKKAYNSID